MSMGSLTFAGLLLAAGAMPMDVAPINQRNFKIPINVKPAMRSEIKELHLFVSIDQGRTWNEVAVAKPDKDAFVYYAPADGVYWFSIQVVDNRDNRQPDDVNKVAPGQKVYVDTLKPAIKMSADRQGDEIAVAWDIQEEHLELASLRMEYRMADMPTWSWTNVPMQASPNGRTRFRPSTSGPIIVRIHAQDQAENVSNMQAEVAGALNAKPVAPAAVTTSAASSPAGAVPLVVPGPNAQSPTLPAQPPAQPAERHGQFQQASLTTVETRSLNDRPPAPLPQGDSSKFVVANSEPAPVATAPVMQSPASRSLRSPTSPAQLTNSTQLALDYHVEKLGPSGVGSVEMYLTQDDGQTWRRYAEDPDLRSPFNLELPGEGVFGLCLVVRSRANLGRKPPQPGELPQMRVEVDMTPPQAQLFEPEADPQRPGNLVLSWSANDRNMAANPIGLEWSERPDGLWQKIGAELPNSGRHTWQLPPNIPGEVFLRLTARDAAGNICSATTAKPVLVDLSVPEGRLIGLGGLNSTSLGGINRR